MPPQCSFVLVALRSTSTMKLLLLFCFLAVQSNAFRVPLPYGTGIPSSSSGQDIGNQGIFHRILTWLADDNSVHGNCVFQYSYDMNT